MPQTCHVWALPGKFFGRDILLEQMPSVLIASPEELVGAVEFAAIH